MSGVKGGKGAMMTRILVNMANMVLLAAAVGLTSCQTPGAGVGPVVLATNGTTFYQVVKPSNATAVDDYAARELVLYLKQITGAEFPVVTPESRDATRPALFLGLSDPARKIIGQDPLGSLKDQEHVARSLGPDIFIYGKGVHGNLYAVMEFMETSLGWRWFSVFEHPVTPSRPTVTLEPFNRKKGFSYAYRKVDMQRGFDYYYQQGMNMGFDDRKRMFEKRRGTLTNLACFVSEIPEDTAGHSLFSYIPPDPKDSSADRFDWLEKKNYFETNPDFFSQLENGRRVNNRQLCFGNPGLRKEFTKNVLKHIGASGDAILLNIAAMDTPGPFCSCKACKALEEKYKSPGGPICDYLIELCGLLREKHPRVLVKTYAYRRSQTQKPPALPAGQKLPENLIIDFAPIEDNYFADWSHPDPRIKETYADLQAWGRITREGNLWAWLYPNGYGSGYVLPVGNVERNINQMRLMHAAGVRGVKTDQIGYHQRVGWSELHSYLYYKLCRDVNADTDAIIKEFTDYFYGPAAPLMRKYLAELESGRKAMKDLPPGVGFNSPNFDDRTFPYLTVENIHRWHGYFEQMDQLLAGRPERERANVRFERRKLDLAVLWKWFELKKSHPGTYTDHKPYVERVKAANATGALPAPAWEGKDMNRKPNPGHDPSDLATLIEAGGQIKPLPGEFDGIDPLRIRQFVPRYPNNCRDGRAMILDPKAAFGYAVPVVMPDLPFNFGFYQGDTKTHGAKRTLALKDIVPGEYTLFKLGEITVTPDCKIWFSSRSWQTNLQLGECLYEPGAENKWDAYVSLKFDGGGVYGGKADETLLPLADRVYYGDTHTGKKETELVLVDRIILVPKSKGQFDAP